MDIYQFSDGTMGVDIWYDGEIYASNVGFWSYRPGGKYSVTFVVDGASYKGGGTASFWSGNFKAVFPTGVVLGKWQTS